MQYPTLFSGGFVGRGNISHKLLDQVQCYITFRALGWSEKLAEPSDKHTDLPNKELITRINCTGPAYRVTCIALILSAIMILKEADKMPDK